MLFYRGSIMVLVIFGDKGKFLSRKGLCYLYQSFSFLYSSHGCLGNTVRKRPPRTLILGGRVSFVHCTV